MYHHILVPVSQARDAAPAVQAGLALAHQSGASLELAGLGAPTRRRVPELAERSAAEAGVSVTATFPEPPYGPALEALIRTHGIDLVIVSARDASARHSPLSSRVQAVVGSASVPVLFVPGPGRPWQEFPRPVFRRMVISLDGSTLAEAVIPFAMELEQPDQLDVTLLTVAPLADASERDASAPAASAPASPRDAAGVEYLARVAETVRSHGARVQTHVAHDPHPAGGIVLYSYMNNMDIIAMSTHGRGALSRLMLGSVAERVMRMTTLPVLLWRPVGPAVPADTPPAAARA